MLMLMVFVMDVRVFVCHFLMRMLVFVALRNMQPDSTGAATPPARTAPARHGASWRVKCAIRSFPGWNLRSIIHADKPNPEPPYNRPASMTGRTSPISSLASGVLIPKRIAAENA